LKGVGREGLASFFCPCLAVIGLRGAVDIGRFLAYSKKRRTGGCLAFSFNSLILIPFCGIITTSNKPI
jgi:hypothetical protein